MQHAGAGRRPPLPPPPPPPLWTRPIAAIGHLRPPAVQLLLLCIKLEEMENVESVSLPADATYTMTASGAGWRQQAGPALSVRAVGLAGRAALSLSKHHDQLLRPADAD